MPRAAKTTAATKTIPLETWSELHDAAEALYRLKPWSFLREEPLFAVQDPATGTVGYCCVTGVLGEHLALLVYPGSAGLSTYLRLCKDLDAAATGQLCLQVSFEDRDVLSSAERGVIKTLGRKYRGAKAWPHFASLRPGYLPWDLEPDEAPVLLVSIQQALVVTARLRDDPRALDPPRRGALLTRVRSAGTWQDQWTTPEPPPPETRLVPRFNPSWLAGVKAQGRPRRGAWQIGLNVLDAVINEKGQRPYLASMFLIRDQQSGMILGMNVIAPADRVQVMAQTAAQVIDASPVLPERFEVDGPDTADVVAPLAEALGVSLVKGRPVRLPRNALFPGRS